MMKPPSRVWSARNMMVPLSSFYGRPHWQCLIGLLVALVTLKMTRLFVMVMSNRRQQECEPCWVGWLFVGLIESVLLRCSSKSIMCLPISGPGNGSGITVAMACHPFFPFILYLFYCSVFLPSRCTDLKFSCCLAQPGWWAAGATSLVQRAW